MDELMTIGAFARMARLSPKALRLYDELGLLPPAAVDGESGYRYYRRWQLERARLVGWLRRLGLPLARIAVVLELPPDAAAAAVAAFRAELAEQLAERDRLAGFLVDYLNGKGSAEMTTGMRYAARTEQGLVRPSNEDAVFAGPAVLAVADGMGGPAGGLASAAAVEALQAWDPAGEVLEGLAMTVRRLEQAVRGVQADGEVVTTLTALLRAGADRFALLHIGDTRAFVLRRGTLTQLTRDHTHVQSLVDEGTLTPEEAATHPQRALLTRALTGGGGDGPDVSTHDSLAGDRYLLASDGLTTVVPADEIHSVLATAKDPDEAVNALVDAAYRAGAPDNIGVAVADVVAL